MMSQKPQMPFQGYDDAFRGMFGKGKYNYFQPQAFELPFLAGMFGPVMQSFQMAGMDPYGGQVREALQPAPSKQAQDKAARFQARAQDAMASDAQDAYVRLPNGTVVERSFFDRTYKDPRHNEWKKNVQYMTGSQAAQRYGELADIYGK